MVVWETALSGSTSFSRSGGWFLRKIGKSKWWRRGIVCVYTFFCFFVCLSWENLTYSSFKNHKHQLIDCYQIVQTYQCLNNQCRFGSNDDVHWIKRHLSSHVASLMRHRAASSSSARRWFQWVSASMLLWVFWGKQTLGDSETIIRFASRWVPTFLLCVGGAKKSCRVQRVFVHFSCNRKQLEGSFKAEHRNKPFGVIIKLSSRFLKKGYAFDLLV